MKAKYAVLLFPVILLFLPLSLSAETELEFGGFADTAYGAAVTGDHEMTSGKTRLRPELEVYSGDLYFNATMDAVYDSLFPGKTGVSLKEAYVEYVRNRFDFRLGRQIVSWGRADGVQITDIVSPKDYSELVGQEYEDSRLPVDALKLRFFDMNYTIEGIWIPAASFSLYPENEDNPLYPLYFPGENFTYRIDEGDQPLGWEDGESGLRASLFLSILDLSLSLFSGWDNDLRYRRSMVGSEILLTREYDRILMGGIDIALPVDTFVFRAEAALTGGRHFAEDSGDSSEKQHLQALAGLDWNPGSNWMITAQYVEDVVLDYEDEINRKEREPAATLSVSKDLFRETLKLACDAMLDLNDRDSAICLKGHYDLSDDFRISLGADFYLPGPDEDGDFGLMEDLSNIWLRGLFSF